MAVTAILSAILKNKVGQCVMGAPRFCVQNNRSKYLAVVQLILERQTDRPTNIQIKEASGSTSGCLIRTLHLEVNHSVGIYEEDSGPPPPGAALLEPFT